MTMVMGSSDPNGAKNETVSYQIVDSIPQNQLILSLLEQNQVPPMSSNDSSIKESQTILSSNHSIGKAPTKI